MLNLVWVALVLLIATIVVSIVRALRLTNASIAQASRSLPLSRTDVTRRLVDRIRSRHVRCALCGGEAFALLGTGTRYQCDRCHEEFEGPEHIPTDVT